MTPFQASKRNSLSHFGPSRRTQFAFFTRDGGCISLCGRGLRLSRSGALSGETPQRVSFGLNSLVFVQPQRVGVEANCSRCCRPTRLRAIAGRAKTHAWRAAILTSQNQGFSNRFVHEGDVTEWSLRTCRSPEVGCPCRPARPRAARHKRIQELRPLPTPTDTILGSPTIISDELARRLSALSSDGSRPP